MSQAPVTMTPDQAYDLLVSEIHAPIFFEKLASHGIHPQTPDEAEKLLHMASQLRQVSATQTVKEAAVHGSQIDELYDDVTGLLNQHGYEKPASSHFKEAASAYAKQPVVQSAVQSYLSFLNSQDR